MTTLRKLPTTAPKRAERRRRELSVIMVEILCLNANGKVGKTY